MSQSGFKRKQVKEASEKLNTLFQNALIFLIQSYRVLISPHFGSCCRFYPSCSVYAQQVIRTRGVFRGVFLTILRLLKCQPLHPGGIDVVKTGT